MGIGDNISNAAENAFEDMAGLSKPTDDGHVPDPGATDEEIKVHSSISEGANAADDSPGQRTGPGEPDRPAPGDKHAGTEGNIVSQENGATGSASNSGDGKETADDVDALPRHVPGPAGLPESGEAAR